MPGSELARRLIVAVVGIPLALVVVVMGGWGLALVLGGAGAWATAEFFAIARARGVVPFHWMGVLASALLVLLTGAFPRYSLVAPWAFGVVLGVLLLALCLAVFRRWPGGRPLSAAAVTTAGALYGGGCLSFGPLLRHLPAAEAMDAGLPLPPGALLLLFPLVVSWVGDSAAYFVGHRFGRRKLIPLASPAKTVEGAWGGLLASVAVGALFGAWVLSLHPHAGVSALVGGGFGLLLGVGAQIGDLAESVLKREAGIKDSGNVLPGHGGILDRFDALMVNIPLGYALFLLLGAVG